jgi:MYXO-CTERM domain-containing protein
MVRQFLGLVLLVASLSSPLDAKAACDDGSCLELTSGNNLVSFRVLPEPASLETVFGQDLGGVLMVRGEGVVAYRLGDGSYAGNLSVLERNRGYWVTLDGNAPITLNLKGTATDTDMRYTLHEGNNLISFPCATAIPVAEAFAPEFVEAVKTIVGEGKIAQKNGQNWLGNLSALEPGKGYWVKVSADLTNFTFNCPSSDGMESYTYGCKDPIATNHAADATVDDGTCEYSVSIAWNVTLSDNEAFYIFHDARVEGVPLKNDEFIGAFAGDQCVGYGHPMGDYTTVRVLGLDAGVPITFKSMLTDGLGADLSTLPLEVLKDSSLVLGGCGIATASNYFPDTHMGIGNCAVMDGCDQVPVGTPCDDGSECTIDDACDASGLCRGGFVGCPEDSPCFAAECLFNGECAVWWTDGDCDDDEPCTVSDVCVEGSCQGLEILCAADEVCVDGACEPTAADAAPEAIENDVISPEDTHNDVDEEIVEEVLEEIQSTDDGPITVDVAMDTHPDVEPEADGSSLDTQPASGDTNSMPEASAPVVELQPSSGCACQAGSSGSGSPLALLVLAFLVVWRRKVLVRG